MRSWVVALCISVFMGFALYPDTGLHGSPRKPRQVIVITLDTARADVMGCYGNKEVKTPNIDRFSRDAVIFKNCFSTANFTNPSHASIFTSLYVKDHGIYSNLMRLPDDPRMMARLFKTAGYKTAGFISVNHLGPAYNFNQGFEEFYDIPGDQHAASRVAEQTNKAVFNWLDKNKDKDFFIWVHYFDPHMPYTPPPPYNTMYKNTSREKISDPAVRSNIEKLSPSLFELKLLTVSDDTEYYRNQYKGEISYLDEHIGRLFNKMKSLGIYDGSIIVMVADHGESLGEHGVYFDHNNSLHDTTVRVPFLLKMRGQGKAGERTQMVSSVDIYPTLFELSGIKTGYPARGRSLVSIINKPKSGGRKEAYSENPFHTQVSIRTEDYTYIRVLKDETGFFSELEFLYNNKKDKGQVNNILTSKPDVAKKLRNRTAAYLKSKTPSGKPREITDKEAIEKLKSLGYTQ